jgi:hypothetical protein
VNRGRDRWFWIGPTDLTVLHIFIDACQRMTDFLSHGQFDGYSMEQLSVVIMSSLFGGPGSSSARRTGSGDLQRVDRHPCEGASFRPVVQHDYPLGGCGWISIRCDREKSLGVSDTSKATAPLSLQAMDGESEALIEGREAA